MVRLDGVEPTSDAYKASVLTVELQEELLYYTV